MFRRRSIAAYGHGEGLYCPSSLTPLWVGSGVLLSGYDVHHRVQYMRASSGHRNRLPVALVEQNSLLLCSKGAQNRDDAAWS